jgi:hypothetical protein
MKEARRGARQRWRNAVEASRFYGPNYKDWDLAKQPLGYYEDSDGYFCRTHRVLGDPWHKCAAWGFPCTTADVPREGNAPRPGSLGREEVPLEIRGSQLKVKRTTRRGDCPAGFILTAEIVGAGTRGRARVTLKGSAGDNESYDVVADDFLATQDDKRIAEVDFVREFRGATERQYWITISGGGGGVDGPRRVSPKGLKVNCRTEGTGGMTLEPNRGAE